MSHDNTFTVDIMFLGNAILDDLPPQRCKLATTSVIGDLSALIQVIRRENGLVGMKYRYFLRRGNVGDPERAPTNLDSPLFDFADADRKVTVILEVVASAHDTAGSGVPDGGAMLVAAGKLAAAGNPANNPSVVAQQTASILLDVLEGGRTAKSTAHAGHDVRVTLIKIGSRFVVSEPMAGEPFLNAAAVDRLERAADETDMVKTITPFLNAALFGDAKYSPELKANPWILTNSELIPWLHHYREAFLPKHMLKPHFLLTKSAVINFRHASGKQGVGKGFVYGGLASQRLQPHRAATYVMDAKINSKITDTHYGVADKYCQHCAPGTKKAMIIVKSEFLLIEFYNKCPVRAIECSNTLDGGATLIRDFFFPPVAEPPTGEDYDFGILSALDFHLAESHAQLHFVDGSCYLGSGATSHVFRVNIDGEVFAMKILISEDTASMFTEYRTLQSMAAAGAPVVSVHPDSFREQVIDGATVSASYLMAVGDSGCPSGNIAEAVKALQDLHNTGFIHGDARKDNLIVVRAPVSTTASAAIRTIPKLVWIDVIFSAATAYRREVDIQTLLSSLTGLREDDARITLQVQRYNPSDTSVGEAIAAQLSAAVGHKRGRSVFESGND